MSLGDVPETEISPLFRLNPDGAVEALADATFTHPTVVGIVGELEFKISPGYVKKGDLLSLTAGNLSLAEARHSLWRSARYG